MNWKLQQTPQAFEILAKLNECKKFARTAMIIAATGSGKTFVTKAFCEKNSTDTFMVTVNSLYRLEDILRELLEQMNIVHTSKNYLEKVNLIIKKMLEIQNRGGKPIIIFDEAENMKMESLKVVKGLYDVLKGKCGIVMLGTDQLTAKISNLRKRNREAIPQLYSRFQSGLKVLPPVNKNYEVFMNTYVKDDGLRRLLYDLCDDYRVLHDYLEPVLVYAEEKSVAVTEEVFRKYHDMPKLRRA